MKSIIDLEKFSKKCRKNLIEMAYFSKGAVHLGGSLSAMDITIAILDQFIDYNSLERSRFILSKGHTIAMLYAIFLEYGIVHTDEKHTLKQIGSRLQGHPDINKIPETDMNTGLLGQGLGVGMGVAYAKKLKKSSNKAFVLCGDAELHEGQIWETIQQAAHYKLNNLIAIIDYNKLSSHDPVNSVISLEPLDQKLRAFNWHVFILDDGNDMTQITEILNQIDSIQDKPIAIIAHTIKGKGISFLENNPDNHSVQLTEESYNDAIKELV
ncbi:MAG: transketolase [Brevinema sp.]